MVNKIKARLLTSLYKKNNRLFLDDIRDVCNKPIEELEGNLFIHGIPYRDTSIIPKGIYLHKIKKDINNLKKIVEKLDLDKNKTILDYKELYPYMNLLRSFGYTYVRCKDFKLSFLKTYLVTCCNNFLDSVNVNYDKISKITLYSDYDLSYYSTNLLNNISILYGLNVILSSILEEYEIDDFMYWLVLVGEHIDIKILNNCKIPFNVFVENSFDLIK